MIEAGRGTHWRNARLLVEHSELLEGIKVLLSDPLDATTFSFCANSHWLILDYHWRKMVRLRILALRLIMVLLEDQGERGHGGGGAGSAGADASGGGGGASSAADPPWLSSSLSAKVLSVIESGE